MNKRVSSQDTRPSLTAQMRQALLDILIRTLSLDIQGRELDDETLWDILL